MTARKVREYPADGSILFLPKEERRKKVEQLYFSGRTDPRDIARALGVHGKTVQSDLEILERRWKVQYDAEALRLILNDTAMRVMRAARDRYEEGGDPRQGTLAIQAAGRLSRQNGMEGFTQVNVFTGPLAQLITMAQNDADQIADGDFRLLEDGTDASAA
jgi:hypothetical protein